jgi:diadenylate cyclase
MDASQLRSALIGLLDLRVLFDILAVSWLIYRLLLLIKGTRAWQITAGLFVFFLAVATSGFFNLYALNWLLRQAFPLGPVALVILFLPELRHALEEFGRPGFWGRSFGLVAHEEMSGMIEEVVSAVAIMSVKRIGALIVFERETALEDIIATGTPLDAEVSENLICTLFSKDAPLHDGAIIIRGGRILAAACTLPLTASPRVDGAVHTRHKAALGMTEESDAVVVVVSEETGTISLAIAGKLLRSFRKDTLSERLHEILHVGDPRGLAGTPIGQVATKVGTAIKTVRVREGK